MPDRVLCLVTDESQCQLLLKETIYRVKVSTSNAKEAEVERFYEHLQDLLELTPKTDVLSIIGDWNGKVGSQDILE